MIFVGGTTIDLCNQTQEYIIKVRGVCLQGNMISTHLVGKESDLQCCNDSKGLAESRE